MNLFDEEGKKYKTAIPLMGGRPDDFQTPAWAIEPLLPYLPPSWTIWECAAGKGNLVKAFESHGYSVIGTDILEGFDYLLDTPQEHWEVSVTNPPFSLKEQFLTRAYSLGKPFALLMPLTTFEGQKRQKLFREHGVQVIFLPKRVNFETPSGRGTGSWFATAFFTWGLNLPHDLVFSE